MAVDSAVDGALVRVDDLCTALIERSAPLRFAEIDDPRELTKAFELRYAAVVEKGWANPAAFPDRLEVDSYDRAAVHLGGWHGAELVATARLVFPARFGRLPTEEAFGIVVEPADEVVDFGRLVVAPAYRGRGLVVLGGVLASAWLAIRTRGHRWFCGVDTRPMIRLYERIGLTVDVLGPAQVYWGVERYPVRFDLARSAATIEGRWREPIGSDETGRTDSRARNPAG